MSQTEFKVVIGGDDEQILQLLLDEEAQAVTNIQAITVVFPDGTEIKSSQESELFDWSTRAAENIVVMTLGKTASVLTVGSHYPVKLFIFDVGHSNGLLWDTVRMRVSPGASS